MNVNEIISAFYKPGSRAYEILMRHGHQVAEKAVAAAERVSHLNPDIEFIHQAAMLHDIGIFLTDTPELGCTGTHPYLCHGYLGRELLEQRRLPRHALVCERHVGTGITREEIRDRVLPLPDREMTPVSLEEQIVCYADKFFSKNHGSINKTKTVEQIRTELKKYGQDHLDRFESWLEMFERPLC